MNLARLLLIAVCALLAPPAVAQLLGPAEQPDPAVLPDGARIEHTPLGRVYADVHGRTLYHTDNDQYAFTTSGCIDECAKTWPPFLAPENARPVKGWSFVTRPDGRRQWTVGGTPAYTFSGDTKPGQANGDGVNSGQWSAVRIEDRPATIVAPPGISVKGRGSKEAVVDVDGMTLYQFTRDRADRAPACAGECLTDWRAFLAPALARPVGEWTIADAAFEERQWAFRGKRVYLSRADAAPGDMHGARPGKGWSVVKPGEGR